MHIFNSIFFLYSYIYHYLKTKYAANLIISVNLSIFFVIAAHLELLSVFLPLICLAKLSNKYALIII